MAAHGSGTWLKVANKGGGTSTVFVSNKLGGRAFNKGETITQSELNTHLSQASKILAKQGIDAAAKFPGTYKAASASASGGGAKIRQINDRLDGMANSVLEKYGQGGKGDRRQTELQANRSLVNEMFPGGKNNERIAKMAARMERDGNREAKAANRLPKAALSKAEKTQIILNNKARIKSEAGKKGDFDQIKRLNRVEKADRQRRKQENPNAPSFVRAAKAAEAKRKKQANGLEGDR